MKDPHVKTDSRGHIWRSLFRSMRFLRPYKWSSVVAFVSLLAVTAAALITPQFVRVLIDRGIVAQDWSWIWISTLGLLLMAVVRGVFSFLQGYLSERVGQGVAFDLRNVIFEKLQTLSFSYHDQAQTGQLMTRVTSDVENVRMFAGQGFLTALSRPPSPWWARPCSCWRWSGAWP